MKVEDLQDWQSFYYVAKCNSFTKAAEEMRCGVANVSKRLNRLEEELGVKLLQRTTRHISLTHDGEALLPRVEAILEDLANLEGQFEETTDLKGTLRITCLPGLSRHFLAPVLTEFSRLHPKVKFEVQLSDEMIDLIDNQIDLAIRAHGISDSTLVLRKLGPMTLKLCASPSYLKRNQRELKSPDDLADRKILMLPAHRKCKFEGSDIKLGAFFDNAGIYCKSGSFLTEMGLEGHCIVVRADWDVAHHIQSGALVEILPQFPIQPYGHIYAAIPTRKLLSHRVRLFLDFLTKKFEV